MPGKTPDKEPVENGGYRGGKDMTDKDLKPKGKKTAKEGDDEMTVVVPPSKKQSSAPPPNDADGDINMDDSNTAEGGEVKVDPVVQTTNGKFEADNRSLKTCLLTVVATCRYQEQLRTSRPCRCPFRCQIYPPRSAVHLIDSETVDARYSCTGYFGDVFRILI